jgi:hypothetical protein
MHVHFEFDGRLREINFSPDELCKKCGFPFGMSGPDVTVVVNMSSLMACKTVEIPSAEPVSGLCHKCASVPPPKEFEIFCE